MKDFNIVSPETTDALLQAVNTTKLSEFRFGAGYTDLILELKQQPEENLTIINLAKLNDPRFTSIQSLDSVTRIGALVTAAQIISDRGLQEHYPVLCQSADLVGSRQLRQVATVGGNLCTASPAADMAAALVALQAHCEILAADGALRALPIGEFFVGVRKTALQPGEILRSVLLPHNIGTVSHSNFIKVGTRRSMEIAVVSLATHFQVDKDDKICAAGVAVGSVAPTIRFARSACDYLNNKRLCELGRPGAETFAQKVLEYASPISDIRASAWYRKTVLHNISKGIFDE